MFHLHWNSRLFLCVYSCILCNTNLLNCGCFVLILKKNKGGPVNWHGVPVSMGTLVPNLSKHARDRAQGQKLPSDLARGARAWRHARATCTGLLFASGASFLLHFPSSSSLLLSPRDQTLLPPLPSTPLPPQILPNFSPNFTQIHQIGVERCEFHQ